MPLAGIKLLMLDLALCVCECVLLRQDILDPASGRYQWVGNSGAFINNGALCVCVFFCCIGPVCLCCMLLQLLSVCCCCCLLSVLLLSL